MLVTVLGMAPFSWLHKAGFESSNHTRDIG